MEFGTTTMQFILALVFVLALIGVLAAVARRMGLGYGPAARGGRGRRRLAVSEVVALDAKRKLVLVRRDNVEHLVILGPNSETLVESAIAGPEASFASAVSEAVATPEAVPSTKPAPASKPKRRPAAAKKNGEPVAALPVEKQP